MSESESDRSPELDQVRQMLFPAAPARARDGRGSTRRFEGASDPQRTAAIERLASGDLNDDLLSLLRLLRDK